MIVAMKKVAVIIQSKDAQAAVKELRRLGLVHIEHQRPPQSQDLNLLQEDTVLVDACLEVFEQAGCRPDAAVKVKTGDWKATAKHVVDSWKRYGYLEDFSNTLEHQAGQWQRWGDFDPQRIQELGHKGIYVKFYEVPLRQLKDFPQGMVMRQVFTAGGVAHCVAVSRQEPEIPFKEVALPKLSLAGMLAKLDEDKKTMQAIKSEICLASCHIPELVEIKKKLNKEIEFRQALAGMGESGQVSYLAGYAPKENEAQILEAAKANKWGIFTSEPQEDDNVPVLMRNPRWVSLINPVFKLMEVVPGYRELDISPLFLLFLSLFFGMIIGDAGYGAVYFLMTFFAHLKFGRKIKDKSPFFLFYLFSSCAVLWGLLTGTVFGQQWYLAKGFKPLAPLLNEAKFLMSFCFFVGALQLSLAHAWQAVSKLPSLKALADAGFICLLWAGFFLAKMFIVGDPFPSFGKWLIWAGILFIIFFSNPQKNIFKAAMEGLGILALGIMGNFGDVVSYIRLFAVGLAGVAVADSVNALAAGAGNNIIAQSLILFSGHLVNIVLGPVSILVHGIRLNVLEFSVLHANVTWSGIEYKPLKS